MNQSLLDKLNELKEEIEKSPEVLELNRLNSLLENNEEVMRLCYRKDVAVTNYEDALKHFGESSKEASQAQKLLYEAKLNLDNNELVKKYHKQYSIVREMYDKINEVVFNPFK